MNLFRYYLVMGIKVFGVGVILKIIAFKIHWPWGVIIFHALSNGIVIASLVLMIGSIFYIGKKK
jgi:hypothetical protein